MHHELTAIDARRKIGEGLLNSVDLVGACLDRIERTDGEIRAWTHLDRDHALAQAAEMDAIRKSGRATGPLHGIPVGLKDIIDTRDFPTERGTPIFAGRRPDCDAALVERLREAGAVILGKTATTELAFMHPTVTTNPHDSGHSPGGSSSGSAAAVASLQVPLAIGTQTNGSVVRPASFCGCFGFKPTRGTISRRGVLQTSVTLDQVGVFARTLEDAALLAGIVGGYDPSDPQSFARPRPDMLAGSREEAPVEPDFAIFELPYDDRMEPDAREGLDEVAAALGSNVERIKAPKAFDGLLETQRIIHEFEICMHLRETFSHHWDELSSSLQPAIERGRAITKAQYDDALGTMAAAMRFFDAFFIDFDAVLTLSAAGEAPRFDDGTGDPAFCTIWTLCGLPALGLPLLTGKSGLPVGVQLVGAVERDERLLRTANWMLKKLQSDGE